VWWSGRSVAPQLLKAVAHVRELGAIAPLGFIAVYVVAVVVLVPAAVLTVAGAAVFGLTRGALYGFCGAVLGSTAAFLVGRHGARRFVARYAERVPRVMAVDRAVSMQGRRIVFLLRLSPIVPFNILNYALSLTALTLGDFLVASFGMIPGTIMYAYYGKVTAEAVALAGQAQVARNASYYALLLVGLAATIAATILVTRAARRALGDV
jgi:uncharacterized membrane protein YdjX (TVP38/TMEM64 family)